MCCVNSTTFDTSELITPSTTASDVADPIYTFACKGQILTRTSDHSFSSNGMLVRKQAIAALKLLKKDFIYVDEDFSLSPIFDSVPEKPRAESNQPAVYSLLGHSFNPFDPQEFSVIMKMVQKKMFTLMNMSRPNFTIGTKRNSNDNKNASRSTCSDPYKLRLDICKVFNLLMKHRDRLVSRQSSDDESDDNYEIGRASCRERV